MCCILARFTCLFQVQLKNKPRIESEIQTACYLSGSQRAKDIEVVSSVGGSSGHLGPSSSLQSPRLKLPSEQRGVWGMANRGGAHG